MDGGESGRQSLEKLRDAGAQLVLDDFGTGYSSLTHLTRLPIGALKVDRSFVAGLGHSARDSAIVSSVTALGTQLGVRVIAEGVETAEQLSILQRPRLLRRAGLPDGPTAAGAGARPGSWARTRRRAAADAPGAK